MNGDGHTLERDWLCQKSIRLSIRSLFSPYFQRDSFVQDYLEHSSNHANVQSVFNRPLCLIPAPSFLDIILPNANLMARDHNHNLLMNLSAVSFLIDLGQTASAESASDPSLSDYGFWWQRVSMHRLNFNFEDGPGLCSGTLLALALSQISDILFIPYLGFKICFIMTLFSLYFFYI